jgi:hypothetical protein
MQKPQNLQLHEMVVVAGVRFTDKDRAVLVQSDQYILQAGCSLESDRGRIPVL